MASTITMSAEFAESFGKELEELIAIKSAAQQMLADHMTSETHHPGYVLVPAVAFEKMRAVVEKVAPTYEAPRDPTIPLRVRGVSRVGDEPRAILLALNERPTDDEIRALHDHLSEVVIA